MNVLLVSSGSGSTGGGEIYLDYLAAGLTRLGHRVHAICSTSHAMDGLADRLRRFGKVERLDFRNTYENPARSVHAVLNLEQQQRLSRAFRECQPDVVHLNQQVAEDGLDLLLAARNSRVPFVSTIHIVRSAERLGARFGRLRDLVTGRVLKKVKSVHITVAEGARHELMTRFPFLDPQRVRVIPNGVIFADTASQNRDRTRARWGMRVDETVLGTVGRLNAQKAPDFALEIVAALRRKGLRVRYVWIGDGSMRTAFLDKARNLGISDFVVLDGWRDDVAACLGALDVFVMPSHFEGMPLALLEAMGVGRCCCVSDVDGMREAIDDEVTGYLCTPGDLDSWCARLGAVIEDANLRTSIGRQAREVAHRHYGIETMAKKTLDVYEDVVRSSLAARAGPG